MDLVQLNQLNNSELKSLVEDVEDICVSLIMPIQQETDKRVENQIRLKNLIQSAYEELVSLDFRRPEIDELLAPAEDLLGDRFLATDSPGLAIYLAPDFSQAYQLPYAPQEMVSVSSQFQIKPLIPLRLNEYFYILTLSQKEVRLLRGTQYTVERMDLHDMPQNLAEALRWDDPERELQWHSQTAPGDGGRDAIFHGHGVGAKETHTENLLRYFQLLDQGLSKLLANEEAPLVLAGVDYLMPIFREANTYGHLIEEGVEGSQEHLSDKEIQQQAWMILQPYFQQKREAAVSLFHQQASKGLASTDLTTVIPAAHQGRVDILFVASDEQRWGRYDSDTGQLDLHSQSQPGDSELLNLGTIYTMLNSGDIYVSNREDVPDSEPIAAILRF
jgi:hypothetical protein